ncbi:MAG: double-strand break repair protein AddB [Rhodospirillales bacterium]|nr:double-strand break repair protein AddB [Rhodospirillales bacterium]
MTPVRWRPPKGPSVFAIPSGAHFVDVLARGIRAWIGDEPESLAQVRVLLPTKRACRSLQDAFLRTGLGRPMLLPRLTPLGDIEEDDLFIEGWSEGEPDGPEGLLIPPAIPPVRRQLLLARLIGARLIGAHSEHKPTPDQAVLLARELARLVDQVHTEGLDFAKLATLVPEKFAEHWQRTLDFLKIVTEAWPKVLAEEGAIDPADRRNRLLQAQAKLWREHPPATPIVAAGSTGSIPATAELLGVIANLPQGVVVLPGLDREADDDTWAALSASHPQYGMARLLKQMGVERASVGDWPWAKVGTETRARAGLINRALAPAAVLERWRERCPPPERALAHVAWVECPTPLEEAETIALAMRRALNDEGNTAALVTPDRGLARRVAAALERFGIAVDDSAGVALSQTPPGAFLRLVARMVADDFAPVPLLAALKHPLAAGGFAAAAFRADIRRLETAALRGPRPEAGLAGLKRAVTRGDFRALFAALARALEPFADAIGGTRVALRRLLAAHVAAAEALAATETETGPERLWAGDAGEALATFVADVGEAAGDLGPIDGAAYPALLDALMAGRVVRPRYGRHPRLHIWGPLEARLQRADVLILGGLNEGTWPPEVPPNPWMSRPMLADFGMAAPERKVGLAAHDFVEAFTSADVILTRAVRVEGTPTVPSRWLMRLHALLKSLGKESLVTHVKDAGHQWLHWQRLLDRPAQPEDPVRPAPQPPVSARPRALSVTQVETWMRDPYAVYARHILGLRALDPIDADPGAADYGAFIHAALDSFVRENPAALPDDAIDRLLAHGRGALSHAMSRPGVWAFWWPRFERIARWFIEEERTRRQHLRTSLSEVRGKIVLTGPAGPFTLHAKADRIDVLKDGTLAVIDYKTGAPPTRTEVAAGFAPQLPLEAVIAEAGGFEGVPRARVSQLDYWRLRGTDPAGERSPLHGDLARHTEEARAGLLRLIAAFDQPETAYEARPRPEAAPRFSDYEHLARVKEWAMGRESSE